ncbi:helix-turn-helix domain-containing protein [Streptomyces sp. NPDC003362]
MSPFDGSRARALRLNAGIGLEDLAAAAGISPNTLRSAESGRRRPRARVVAALACALGVTTDDLHSPLPEDQLQELPLREIRQHLGLTQQQIGQLTGTGRQMVSRVERGVSGVSCPDVWAAAYHLTASQWETAQQQARQAARHRGSAAQAAEHHTRGTTRE